MRFRSRSAPVSVVEVPVRCYHTDGTLFYEYTNTSVTTTYGESIADDATKVYRRGSTGRSLWPKPVNHTRWSYEPDYSLIRETREPGTWYADQSGIGQICDVLLIPHLPTDIGLWASSVLQTAVPDPFTGHYDRWNRVRPTTATRANLFVSLCELSDIKRMFDIIPKRHLSYKRRSIRSWRDVLPHIEVANGAHLNYNFGWKPFFADVYNVAKAVDSHKARLNKLLMRQGQLLNQHVSDAGDTGTINSVIPTFYTEWQIRITGTYTCRLSSTFKYEYQLPAYSAREMRLRSWLDALGLNPTPANFWAIVPWSFVVDWFVDVGGMLQKQSSDWITPWISWHESLCSVKYLAKATVSAYRVPTGVTYPAGSVMFKHYSRRLGFPDMSVEEPGSLDADKIRLLASLLVQQVL